MQGLESQLVHELLCKVLVALQELWTKKGGLNGWPFPEYYCTDRRRDESSFARNRKVDPFHSVMRNKKNDLSIVLMNAVVMR